MPADRPHRALFVTSNFPRWPGDTTTPFVLHLAVDLRAHGWTVDVLAPHAPGAASAEVLDGVAVRRFRYLWPDRAQTVCYGGGALINLRVAPTNLLKVPALVAAEWATVFLALRRGGYDVLHTHWVLPQGWVGELADRGRVPHVTTVHGGDVFALRSPVLVRFKRRAILGAEAVTVNSRATAAAVHEIAPTASNVQVIPIGTDVDSRADPARVTALRAAHRVGSGPLLVFVGRLVREKGIEDVVATVAALRPRHPDVRAVLVGAGQDEDVARALAARLGVAGQVAFAGWVAAADVPNWLHAADIVLAPSRVAPSGWTEAQGLTVIEALAAARPVVAAAVGGIPDTVTHGETGLLVPPEQPAALAAAVDRLVADPGLAATLGARGRRSVQDRFSRAASAARFAEVYAQIRR